MKKWLLLIILLCLLPKAPLSADTFYGGTLYGASFTTSATDRILLDDGTSHILLDDGTSKILLAP